MMCELRYSFSCTWTWNNPPPWTIPIPAAAAAAAAARRTERNIIVGVVAGFGVAQADTKQSFID